jgi:lysozyme family protein
VSAGRFLACLQAVLTYEGGFVDNPQDNGGATCWGITLATLSEYSGRPCTVEDVKALTPVRAQPVYEALYWTPIQGEKLPMGVDLFVFDTAVNMGVGTAAKMLQTALNVTADGVIGPQTLSAPAMAYPKALILKLSKAREQRYRSLDDFDVFGDGWLTRLANVTAQALDQTA